MHVPINQNLLNISIYVRAALVAMILEYWKCKMAHAIYVSTCLVIRVPRLAVHSCLGYRYMYTQTHYTRSETDIQNICISV